MITAMELILNLKQEAMDALYSIATGANDNREQLQDFNVIRSALQVLPDGPSVPLKPSEDQIRKIAYKHHVVQGHIIEFGYDILKRWGQTY